MIENLELEQLELVEAPGASATDIAIAVGIGIGITVFTTAVVLT